MFIICAFYSIDRSNGIQSIEKGIYDHTKIEQTYCKIGIVHYTNHSIRSDFDNDDFNELYNGSINSVAVFNVKIYVVEKHQRIIIKTPIHLFMI